MIHFDISKIQLEINELEKKVNAPNFWDNPTMSTPIVTKLKRLKNEVETFRKLEQELNNIDEMSLLLIDEPDEQMSLEVLEATKKVEKELNELEIKKHISYEIVYYPELLRTLKEDLSLVESKVSYYSNVEILVLDDIGAENVTNWGRDEILGTILQERMNKHKTTFFTSNLDINELEKHLSCSKDNVDNVKARRIIERIKQLTIDMPLISVNRRN